MKPTTNRTRPLAAAATLALAILLGGCGLGGVVGGASSADAKLHGALYEGGGVYTFGQGAALDVRIEDAPDDTDFDRWAMLHDGSRTRLYFMREGGAATLYQFALNPDGAYQFGFASNDEVPITGMPAGADPSSFAMLHDGANYRLYMRDTADPRSLYQFAYNPSTGAYEYGFRSIGLIPIMTTTGMPGDTDFTRWGMTFGDGRYRQYVARAGTDDVVYQAGFNGFFFAYGFESVTPLTVVGAPGRTDTSAFAVTNDGDDYFLYMLGR